MLSVVARSGQSLESADSTNMASSAFYGLIGMHGEAKVDGDVEHKHEVSI